MGARGLVIFDCDGVLVDSEPLAVDCLRALISEAGVDIPLPEAYARFLGRSIGSITAEMQADFGLTLTPGMLERMRVALLARFEAELQPIPHIAEAIRAIRAMPDAPAICVASSSQPARIEFSLRLCGLLDLLAPSIYSAVMVSNGKPAPDLFLFAAAQMGAAPEECVVVEDSEAGLKAAAAAGMRTLAFTGGGHAGPGGLAAMARRHAPYAIFDDMRDLPGLVAAACGEGGAA